MAPASILACALLALPTVQAEVVSTFGSSIAGLGDVDGDGRDDFVVGGGGVRVFSGASGRLLYAVEDARGDHLGHAFCRLDDLDGDGVRDFAAAALVYDEHRWGMRTVRPDSVRILSARNGATIRTIREPEGAPFVLHVSSVTAIADVDGDGRRDLLIPLDGVEGGADRIPAPVAGVFSSATGALVHQVGLGSEPLAGHRTSSPGDVDGDGVPEVVLANLRDGRGVLAIGAARTRLWERRIDVSQRERARHLCEVGDVDRDGSIDLLVAWGPSDQATAVFVELLSGRDGTVLRTHRPVVDEDLWTYGDPIAAAGDVDGDGIDDYLVAADAWWARVWLRSGATGDVLFDWTGGDDELGDFGAALAGVGDVDGDGTPDVAIGTATSHRLVPGKVSVFSGRDGRLLYRVRASGPEER